jgi:uncharacterized protein (TIGR02147 family)
MPVKFIPEFINFLALSPEDGSYFTELVLLGRSRTDKEALAHYERLQNMRPLNVTHVRSLAKDVYRDWLTMNLRCLLSIVHGKPSPKELAKMLTPEVSEQQVKDSISLLVDLGMVNVKDDCYEVAPGFTLGKKSTGEAVIRKYHSDVLEAMRIRYDGSERRCTDFSSVTIPIRESDFPAIRERIKQFRSELMRFSADGSNEDTVLQIFMGLIPCAQMGDRHA